MHGRHTADARLLQQPGVLRHIGATAHRRLAEETRPEIPPHNPVPPPPTGANPRSGVTETREGVPPGGGDAFSQDLHIDASSARKPANRLTHIPRDYPPHLPPLRTPSPP
ncbi:hypothetical protein GCM10010420_15510 [Streptomyces glaucosporus]|uniref:Uncharacterized protein n=1 Tax=Streptomyces glaucosporus TaxID=284044 RepID=A0ABP5V1H4_9ACTN